ncbi:MAG: hypothetical protein J5948_03060 [Bacteroidales bacterium]|nr:hypothetical protein [Bacteroidales bacterium]
MDNQVQTIVCPNCGANASNHQNCEYCGSLLVRFRSLGEDINDKVFGKNAYIVPELEDNLKRNLLQQELGGAAHTIAGAVMEGEVFPLMFNITPLMKSGQVSRNLSSGESFGFYGADLDSQIDYSQFDDICVAENLHTQVFFISSVLPKASMELKKTYIEDRVAEDHFKDTTSSTLFTKVEVPLRNMANGEVLGTMNVYYINFGKDAKNAAFMISEILEKLAPSSDGWIHTSQTDLLEGAESPTNSESINPNGLRPEEKESHVQWKNSRKKGPIILLIAGLAFILLYFYALATEGFHPEDLILLLIGIVLLFISALKNKKKTQE